MPFFLAGGEISGDIELFELTLSVPGSDPLGTYSGTYGLFGGSDGSAQENLGQSTFSVNVVPSSAPEPASLATLGMGLVLIGLLFRWSRSTRS